MTIPAQTLAIATGYPADGSADAPASGPRDAGGTTVRQHLFLRMLQGSAVIANEATSVETAISSALRYLCRQMDWQVGHAFLPNEQQQFVSSEIWYLDHPDDYGQFQKSTEALSLTPGQGLAGRVLVTGRPLWIPDVTQDDSFDRREDCVEPPLRAGVGFPILIDGEVTAILELYNSETQPVDSELLDVLEHVGVQLGLVVERFRARNTLETINADLKRSNRELEEFASIASHDLQEPLRKIQAFGDRLQTRHGHLLSEEGQMYVQRMRADAARMQTLINDLLSYSRISANSRHFVQVDLMTIVARIIADLDDPTSSGATLEVGSLPTIEADPSQMRQLFQNLISNALKFQRDGIPPVIQIAAERMRGTRGRHRDGTREVSWTITVSDNGIGFKPQHAERIFQMFERLHGRSVYEGTGIGLAICRKIVERHSGTIIAAGVLNEGSVLTITLPAR